MKKLSSLIILLLAADFVSGQNNVFRKLSIQSAWVWYNNIMQTDDGGFAIPASTDTLTAGLSDYTFFRLDSTGNLLWQKTYGTVNNEATTQACKMSDGGFAITGVAAVQNLYRINVIRIDSAGNLLWSKLIGNFGCTVRFIRETANGGLILIAWGLGGIGQSDIFFIKLDSTGNVISAKAFGSTEIEAVWSAASTSDGGVIVSGDSFVRCTTVANPFLLKIDSAGNMMWHKILFWTNCGGQGFDVMQTTDGNYLAGLSGDLGTAIAKFDSTGNVKWSTFFMNDITGFKDIKELSDGYIFADLEWDSSYIARTTFFSKVDTSGNLIWSKRFVDPTGQYAYWFNKFETTNTDDIIMAGDYRDTSVSPKQNFFVQKFPVSSFDSICNSQPIPLSFVSAPLHLDSGFVEINFPGVTSSNFGTVTNTPSFSFSDICLYNTGIVETDSRKSIDLYPNPFIDVIKVAGLKIEKKANIAIYDLMGEKVFEQELSPNKTEAELNLSFLQQGVYFLQVKSKGESWSRKIVKM